MKELYLSDLDGTLLGSDARLSTATIDIINELISDGLNFTIATARPLESALELVKDLHLKLPIIMMNGVLVYDPVAKEFLKTEYLGSSAAKQVASVLNSKKADGMMYKLIGGETVTFYKKPELLNVFYDSRNAASNRKFIRTDSFYDIADDNTIYFVINAKLDKIKEISADINKIPGVTDAMYEDVYSAEEIYYYEVFSEKASKAAAALFLKQHLSVQRLISFGDNFNDMCLFSASDESYAVADARPELKAIATATIGSCTADGVAKFLKERFL